MKLTLNVFLILGCVSCATYERRMNPATDRSRLFPPGLYNHRIEVKSTGKNFSFQGVVKITPEELRVTGLSPLQTTIMSIHEDRLNKKVTLSIFQNDLENHRSLILRFYEILSQLLTMSRSGVEPGIKTLHERSPGIADEILIQSANKTATGGKEVDKKIEIDTHIHFSSFDEFDIPHFIQIDFKEALVKVEVVGYEI